MLAGRGDGMVVTCRPQRTFEVFDQVAYVLESDREADQGVADPHLPPHLGLDRGVGHRRRMTEEALHAAEAFGERPQSEALREVAGIVECAVDLERDDGPGSCHLPARYR